MYVWKWVEAVDMQGNIYSEILVKHLNARAKFTHF